MTRPNFPQILSNSAEAGSSAAGDPTTTVKAATTSAGTAQQGQTLVVQLRETIRGRILAGSYQIGDRLPSEARLTEEFGVSRTVVREAIAALRADGLVAARQGAGVFVLEPPAQPAPPFSGLDPAKVSSLIEMLELRTAVEGDAAGLAAIRRSPAQEERIIEALGHLRSLASQGKPTGDADFAFHLAIAEAANNPRFAEFLHLIGPSVIPRRAINSSGDVEVPADYANLLDAEHDAVISAILSNEEAVARQAMRDHLKNSQIRYRDFLRQSRR